ncbi:MAG: hypothetical protein AB7T48_10220 [Solirubrobacterales bacterium]
MGAVALLALRASSLTGMEAVPRFGISSSEASGLRSTTAPTPPAGGAPKQATRTDRVRLFLG